jgi:creatinine amidohydrolase
MDGKAADSHDEDPGRELLLAGMLSPRVRSSLEKDDLDVLIPLGALEQHGPHLPLGTDTTIAQEVGIEVARRVHHLVVAPCLPVGCSDHHLSFAGTASIPADVVAGYVRSVALTLLGHGFRFAYVFSGHAGNIPAMKAALTDLPPNARGRVAAFVDWPAQRRALHDLARTSLGLSGEDVGSHSGHFETSVMLELAPGAVYMQSAPRGYVGPVEEASRLMNAEGIASVSEVGVIGDARSATADAGSAYLEVIVASIAGFVERHRAERGES